MIRERMKIIRYFIIEDNDTIDGIIRVSKTATKEDIENEIIAEVAERVTTNAWSVDWEEIDG